MGIFQVLWYFKNGSESVERVRTYRQRSSTDPDPPPRLYFIIIIYTFLSIGLKVPLLVVCPLREGGGRPAGRATKEKKHFCSSQKKVKKKSSKGDSLTKL